jgi:hypothetical protein
MSNKEESHIEDLFKMLKENCQNHLKYPPGDKKHEPSETKFPMKKHLKE